jgi:hypothetical protein
MYLGAITFKSVFGAVQKAVTKAKAVTGKASDIVDKYTPAAPVQPLPVEIPAASAIELPMSQPTGPNWLLIGGVAVAGLAALKFFKGKRR